jgi:hypothetical protein
VLPALLQSAPVDAEPVGNRHQGRAEQAGSRRTTQPEVQGFAKKKAFSRVPPMRARIQTKPWTIWLYPDILGYGSWPSRHQESQKAGRRWDANQMEPLARETYRVRRIRTRAASRDPRTARTVQAAPECNPATPCIPAYGGGQRTSLLAGRRPVDPSANIFPTTLTTPSAPLLRFASSAPKRTGPRARPTTRSVSSSAVAAGRCNNNGAWGFSILFYFLLSYFRARLT